jgi:uncharacterized membrane-anchored protein YhcB (DUF1043 family)
MSSNNMPSLSTTTPTIDENTAPTSAPPSIVNGDYVLTTVDPNLLEGLDRLNATAKVVTESPGGTTKKYDEVPVFGAVIGRLMDRLGALEKSLEKQSKISDDRAKISDDRIKDLEDGKKKSDERIKHLKKHVKHLEKHVKDLKEKHVKDLKDGQMCSDQAISNLNKSVSNLNQRIFDLHRDAPAQQIKYAQK